MTSRLRDPLLAGTRLLLLAITILLGIGGAIAFAALGPVWLFSGRVLAWLSAHTGGLSMPREALVAITIILIGLIAEDVLGILFLRRLIAIIDTVGQGSPFISDNTRRLRTMGWLVLAMQAIIIIGTMLTPWFRAALMNPRLSSPFSLTGLITALLLFILARVFDHGTQLAEDVEGTV